jgi:hypothetical protein
MDLLEVGWGSVDWIFLAQGQVESSFERRNEVSGSVKCWNQGRNWQEVAKLKEF